MYLKRFNRLLKVFLYLVDQTLYSLLLLFFFNGDIRIKSQIKKKII